jgi:predicted transcriptional regulator
MRDHAIALEQDPASERLAPEQVVLIHKAHRSGVAWDEIASDFGITRKQVQRIVQGRRHRKLHPDVAPNLNDFYGRDVFKDTPEALALAAHINSFLA